MLNISTKLTALITTLAVAAPASAAEAASGRHLTRGRHMHPASTQRHYGDGAKFQPISSSARLHRYGANWR